MANYPTFCIVPTSGCRGLFTPRPDLVYCKAVVDHDGSRLRAPPMDNPEKFKMNSRFQRFLISLPKLEQIFQL